MEESSKLVVTGGHTKIKVATWESGGDMHLQLVV